MKKPLAGVSVGVFRVDASCCINCGLCRESSRTFFRQVPENEAYRIARQPRSAVQVALMVGLKDSCPTKAIVLKDRKEG